MAEPEPCNLSLNPSVGGPLSPRPLSLELESQTYASLKISCYNLARHFIFLTSQAQETKKTKMSRACGYGNTDCGVFKWGVQK